MRKKKNLSASQIFVENLVVEKERRNSVEIRRNLTFGCHQDSRVFSEIVTEFFHPPPPDRQTASFRQRFVVSRPGMSYRLL